MDKISEKNKICLLIFLLSFAFSAILMPAHLLYDEFWTLLNFVQLDIFRILTDLSLPNNHPLNTLMLKIFSFSPHTEKKSFIKEADDFMLQNIGMPVTLDDLAKLSGKSKYLFLRQYHSETGITPMKKLWDMRCEEALDLLKFSDLTIKEIAFQTGFSDAAHFSRRIKNHCGKTPSEIRKKHL